jgi:hypothetical protein
VKKPMPRRIQGWSYRRELNNRTAAAMIANKHGWKDKTAIRTLSNDIMDAFEKAGVVSRKESDHLSQDITIEAVQKILKGRGATG